jgi:hypothetical protein
VSTAAPYSRETRSYTGKGLSLARGPALIVGIVLSVAGLYALYKEHTFPPFSHLPNGTVPDHTIFFGIFGANGWTGMFTAVAGILLLIGAAQHLFAKTMSLIVGIALGIAAVIGFISGNVLGMAASNIWTEVLWAGCAVILLFNTLSPRRTTTVTEESTTVAPADEPIVARRSPVASDEPVAAPREPAHTRDGEFGANEDNRLADDRVDDTVAENPSAEPITEHHGDRGGFVDRPSDEPTPAVGSREEDRDDRVVDDDRVIDDSPVNSTSSIPSRRHEDL